MQHVFSAAGSLALERVLHPDTLLAFDFDGTLAPIVARPEEARVSATIATKLGGIAQRWPVAIISGRSVADVTTRLGFSPRFVVGNHGAEGLDENPSRWEKPLDPLRARLMACAGELAEAGVQVEDKTCSIALHYRMARNRAAAAECISRVLEDTGGGLRVFGGKCVVNIAAADAPDKAGAVERLLAALRTPRLLFVGDDVNDEVVFERARDDWLTVRIGRDAPRSMAKFFLDSDAEMGEFLQRVLMRAPGPSIPR